MIYFVQTGTGTGTVWGAVCEKNSKNTIKSQKHNLLNNLPLKTPFTVPITINGIKFVYHLH